MSYSGDNIILEEFIPGRPEPISFEQLDYIKNKNQCMQNY